MIFGTPSFLEGAYARIIGSGRALDFEIWLDGVREAKARAPPFSSDILWEALSDPDLAAILFEKEAGMANVKRKNKTGRGDTLTLPTERRVPVNNPWEYAYLLTGEKKIGKTTFAIEGGDVLVLQFDKPQIAYEIIEVCPNNWKESKSSPYSDLPMS